MRKAYLGQVEIWNYVSVIDLVFIPLHIGFGYALWDLPPLIAATPFYQHFSDVMPLDYWAVGLWLMVACIIIGHAIRKLPPVVGAYMALAAFWIFATLVSWIESPSLVGTVFFFSFTIGCIARPAALIWRAEQNERAAN